MPLKFCANLSFMFQESTSLLERYCLARNAGFRAVECAVPYDYPIEAVSSAKKTADVEQILINIFAGDASKGEAGFAAIPGKEEDFKKSLSLAVKYAKALDCKRIHIMSGKVQNIEADNHKAYESNLRYAASVLEKENIIGLIEPINNYSVPNYFMNSFEQGLRLVESINSQNLKVQLDLFHLQLLNGRLTHNIKQLLPHVGHIQVAQVPHRNEPNTAGEINYPYIFSLLEELEYDGWIGLEYKPAGNTKEGLKWIEEYGLQL